MNGSLQSRINPLTPHNSVDFSDKKVTQPTKDPENIGSGKTSFKDLLLNSNDEVAKQRAAQKNGDGLKAAKNDEEFAAMLNDRLNRDNLRKPQNNLDKDAFLKLFITQMQNQDPLKPDDSAQMAAQLAQFNGLEQMMNVNKNLEKMQAEASLSRAVGLTSFVGKEVTVAGNRAMLKAGHLSHLEAHVERDVSSTTMEVRNSAGVVIAARELNPLKAGDNLIEWDGMDSKGQKAAEGLYTIDISAKDANGLEVPVQMSSVLAVKGVSMKEAGGSFHTEIGPVKISEISSVGEVDTARKALVRVAAGKDSGESYKEQPVSESPMPAESSKTSPTNQKGSSTQTSLQAPQQTSAQQASRPSAPKISPTGEIISG